MIPWRRLCEVVSAGVFALLVAAHPAGAAGSPTLEQALEAYRSAQETSVVADRAAAFARAERLFAAAAREGDAGPQLWTNLGTSALQAENLGAAVLAYRRALALDPDQRQAAQNLVHARTLLPSWVPRPESGGFLDSFLAWQHAMSAAERHGTGAIVFLITAAMLGTAFATGSGILRGFAIFPLLLWAVLIVSEGLAGVDGSGVLTAPDTIARAADSRNAPARFAEPLPAGTEVVISEIRGQWARIVLANGRDAWVSAAAVEAVLPHGAVPKS